MCVLRRPVSFAELRFKMKPFSFPRLPPHLFSGSPDLKQRASTPLPRRLGEWPRAYLAHVPTPPFLAGAPGAVCGWRGVGRMEMEKGNRCLSPKLCRMCKPAGGPGGGKSTPSETTQHIREKKRRKARGEAHAGTPGQAAALASIPRPSAPCPCPIRGRHRAQVDSEL